MIEITIKKGPESCPGCERSLQHGQERTTCEACKRTFHQACWDEAQGCKACPAAAAEGPAPAGEPESTADPSAVHGPSDPGSESDAAQGEAPRWLDDPANVKRMLKVFWGICALLVLVDGLDLLGLYERHAHFPLEGIPGFYAFYGFVACVCLVFTAKGLRKIVMRPEDYYDRG